MRYESSEAHDWRNPENAEEAKEYIYSEPDKSYYDKKSILGIDKEMFSSDIYGIDTDVINKIEKYVVDGKIDYDKLASGEEVIFVVPQKAQYLNLFGKNRYGSRTIFDESIGKRVPGYTAILTGESDYKAGDELTFAVSDTVYDDKTDAENYSLYSKGTAKIGAIIRPNSITYREMGFSVSDVSIVTSISGINQLVKGLDYRTVKFNVLTDIDDDTDEKIIDDMTKYREKHDGYLLSRYEEEHRQVENLRQILTAIIALVIIGFVICISIVNNSITAHIRENKRVIGTLRAVGADAGDLVKTYIRQMLTMFGWGTGIGYGIFVLIYVICAIVASRTVDGNLELVFNPWITIIMTVLSFAVCTINVYAKIKKEMKNSIVDNIREL